MSQFDALKATDAVLTHNAGLAGVASRSGTLSYEAAASCKHIGQSLILGLGGDFYPGTRTVEALKFFMDDENTKGIIVVGEVGGVMEEEAAQLVRKHYLIRDETGRLVTKKPMVGFIAGRNVPPGQVFGHSGAIWRDGLSSADQKRQAWSSVGIKVVDAIADTGAAIEVEMKARGLLHRSSDSGVTLGDLVRQGSQAPEVDENNTSWLDSFELPDFD